MKRHSIRPIVLVICFAATYTLAVLLIGVLPVNRILMHYFPAQAATLWRGAAFHLFYTFLTVTVGGAIVLLLTRRLRGVLTGELLWPRTLIAGILGGTLDVTMSKLLVHHIAALRQTAPRAAILCGAALSLGITAGVMLAMIVRVTTVQPSRVPRS